MNPCPTRSTSTAQASCHDPMTLEWNDGDLHYRLPLAIVWCHTRTMLPLPPALMLQQIVHSADSDGPGEDEDRNELVFSGFSEDGHAVKRSRPMRKGHVRQQQFEDPAVGRAQRQTRANRKLSGAWFTRVNFEQAASVLGDLSVELHRRHL